MALIMHTTNEVPGNLRTWFVVHFAADMLFAIPLMFFPEQFLQLFGWTVVDTVSARLVAAALIGIGVESFLGRNAGIASFRTMLRLKALWSGSAIIGLTISILGGAPRGAWVFLAIFVAFFALWFSKWLSLREP